MVTEPLHPPPSAYVPCPPRESCQRPSLTNSQVISVQCCSIFDQHTHSTLTHIAPYSPPQADNMVITEPAMNSATSTIHLVTPQASILPSPHHGIVQTLSTLNHNPIVPCSHAWQLVSKAVTMHTKTQAIYTSSPHHLKSRKRHSIIIPLHCYSPNATHPGEPDSSVPQLQTPAPQPTTTVPKHCSIDLRQYE